jgi:hypothetical protein
MGLHLGMTWEFRSLGYGSDHAMVNALSSRLYLILGTQRPRDWLGRGVGSDTPLENPFEEGKEDGVGSRGSVLLLYN